MTAPGLSPAEQATVDRFEAAKAAPESWVDLMQALRDELATPDEQRIAR